MSVDQLGSLEYNRVMTLAAAQLTPPAAITAGNAHAIRPGNYRVYGRILTADGKLPLYPTGSALWMARMREIAAEVAAAEEPAAEEPTEEPAAEASEQETAAEEPAEEPAAEASEQETAAEEAAAEAKQETAP